MQVKKRIHGSIVVAILGALGTIIVSVPAIRLLVHPRNEAIINNVPLDLDQLFAASGWMGDGSLGQGYLRSDKRSTQKASPDGGNVWEFSYKPGPNEWAGILWQYPANNWGTKPGLEIRGAKRLTFLAAGSKGGEMVEFRCGTPPEQSKKYADTIDRTLGTVSLTKDWKRFSIDLNGANLTSVISGFGWIMTRAGNPEGATFYLNSIRIE